MHQVSLALPPEVRSVAQSRRMVRDAVATAGIPDMRESAELAISELVTNVVLHAGTSAAVSVHASTSGLRVEVRDGSTHPPTRRTRSATAGTGRGLHLVDQFVDRWGFVLHADGKTVWFEIGSPEPTGPAPDGAPGQRATAAGDVAVTLLNVPLLMHWAWQEHAAALLREFLLFSLDDDPGVLEQHARASDALALLHEQLAVPVLPDDPDALMADAVEPGVSAAELELTIPARSVTSFEVLEELLERAIRHANAGDLLGPPTQPEIGEMRQWLCEQVCGQASGTSQPTPWKAREDVRTPLRQHDELAAVYRELSRTDEALIVSDDSSVIVAVTAPVLEFLGYDDESQLLGRRVIVVVPPRFHQAHIAGTTLHVTNGRDPLLDVDLTVPVVRADGTEAPVGLNVAAQHVDHGRRVFIARFQFPDDAGTPASQVG